VQSQIDEQPFGEQLRRWRRVRRISQLELALRADTTQRHVSYLEQGRSRPGRTMILRLAEALQLSLRERNGLLLSAGFAPVYAESRLEDEALRPVRDALHTVLEGHMPYPALIAETGGRLVAANAATDVLTLGAKLKLLAPPVNALLLMVHPDGMAPRVQNLAEWGRHIIENVRAHALHSPDQRLDELLVQLERYVPDAAPGPNHLGFAVPLRLRCNDTELRLITTLTSFATAVDVTLAELHLEAYLPADDATARALHERQRPTRSSRSFPPELIVGSHPTTRQDLPGGAGGPRVTSRSR
jgi:transcriptional regulator with XRE-family HTH domain